MELRINGLRWSARRDYFGLWIDSSDFLSRDFVDTVDYILSVCSVEDLELTGSWCPNKDPNHPKVYSSRVFQVIQKALAGGQLRCLSMKYFELKSEHILILFELLRRNNTLERLDFKYQRENIYTTEDLSACRAMLAGPNTSLIECCPFQYHDPTIQYYLDLNRLGRARVRKGNDLLDLLLAAQQDRTLTSTDGRVQSVLYGLLRESPGTWAPGTWAPNQREL